MTCKITERKFIKYLQFFFWGGGRWGGGQRPSKFKILRFLPKILNIISNSFCKYGKSRFHVNGVQLQLHWSRGSAEKLRARLK